MKSPNKRTEGAQGGADQQPNEGTDAFDRKLN